jgi:hypothetical protein
MLSPEALQAVEHLRANLRVEVTTEKVGGPAYFDGQPGTNVTVRLYLGDDVISEDTSTVLRD